MTGEDEEWEDTSTTSYFCVGARERWAERERKRLGKMKREGGSFNHPTSSQCSSHQQPSPLAHDNLPIKTLTDSDWSCPIVDGVGCGRHGASCALWLLFLSNLKTLLSACLVLCTISVLGL